MFRKLIPLAVLAALGATAATAAAPTDPQELRLRPVVRGCPICELWLRYEDVVLQAKQEVAPLENGILYFYHSDDPAVIEPLIRFANERAHLEKELQENPELRAHLGMACGHTPNPVRPEHLEISTSARGIIALITTDDPTTLQQLRSQASRVVLSKLPLWF